MQKNFERFVCSVEKDAISNYIASCTNFRSNISYTDISTINSSSSVASHILLIGCPDKLKEKFVTTFPFYCPIVAEALTRIEANETISILTQPKQEGDFVSITIAGLPSDGSRTNCPYRADFVSKVIARVTCEVAASKKDAHDLDVFVCMPEGCEVAMANAISRGTIHSFSCGKGVGSENFTRTPVVHINIIHCSRAHFTGDVVDGHAVTVAELENLCTSVQLCQRLVDTPTCILDTVVFTEIVKSYATELGVNIDIIKGEELCEQGYGGIYAVGHGAQYPPHLVTLHYINNGAGTDAKNVALVGKGIVYDCGGLAIKPAAGMANMKSDMAGSAAVFCGFLALIRNIKVRPEHYKNIRNISVTLCLAENAISAESYRNGDIVFMKSGKSVEVINTDAEGRIVLGDGVYYASDQQSFVPDILIDMATLTGAQGVATGTKHAALYISDAAVEEALLKAGRKCGDTCFPVLYSPEHHKPQFKSKFADMTNLMPQGTDGGVSCGGYFIESHLSPKFTGVFAHIDLAFPSFNDEGATGFGVSLITEYLRTL